jgi:hypothetical protein
MSERIQARLNRPIGRLEYGSALLRLARRVVVYPEKRIRMNKIYFVLIGAVFGLLVVRGFFLDPAEEIGWRIFWDALFRGHIGMRGLREAAGSATFAKSMLGIGVGAAAGYFASNNTKGRRRR